MKDSIFELGRKYTLHYYILLLGVEKLERAIQLFEENTVREI